MASQLVKLNVGGVRYMTTAATLTSRGDNFFSVLLKQGTPVVRDEEGYIFIDRDGSYFAPLLAFLRTGELDVPASMSRRQLEREALFYLIDLSQAGGAVVVNPLTKTSVSLAGVPHADLRYDGAYVQRLPTGQFAGYYIFSPQEEVRYRSINNINANELVYCRPSRFTKLSHPWLVMHWGSPANPAKMIASVQPHGLTVEWRYPPRPEHRKPLALHFWPSVEPLLGVLFSDETCRSPNAFSVRVFFADRQRATVTVLERSGKVAVRKQADYTCETREGLCVVTVQNAVLELTLLSLSGLLIETGCTVKRPNLSRGKIDLTSRSVRVMVAVGTEPDPSPEPERDEIDIYEFLRTYQPAVQEDDSSDAGGGGGGGPSEDGDTLLLDEPYLMAARPTVRAAAPTVDL
jgi:hypothetical protein